MNFVKIFSKRITMRNLVTILVIVQIVFGGEVLKNPGFEDSNLSGSWNGWGFKMESITSDVHGGSRAVKVTGRTQYYQGPSQDVPLVQGGRYSFKSTVKQLNDKPDKMFQMIKITISYVWADNGKTDYYDIAQHPFIQSSTGWFSLNGDFTAPMNNFTKASLYFQGPEPGIDFIVDDASLQTVAEDSSWKAEADARIQKIRKNNINVQVTKDASVNAADIEIKIDHKRHLFGFGSVINEDWITNDDYKEYQNLVYSMFNWVTAGSFKWKYNRGTKDSPNYKFATDAVKVLKSHGMKVRGHNMFWGVPGNSPSWVEALGGDGLKKAISERVTYMTGITKGLLDHWDINNELLHGQLYEEKTKDPNYSEKIYNMVKKADPGPDLFLNDYDVVAVGAVTDAYVDQALEFLKDNTSLDGLGLQSHFRDYTPPDPTLLKIRLDKLAKAGLPLWITEMDLVHHDENIRADYYDQAFRTYFSHPAVDGVILWGFWDHQMKSPYAALINGYNFFVNAAGRRYFDLVKKEWSTHESHKLSAGSSFKVNAFHGDYDVVVYNKGVPIMYQEFHLGKADKDLKLHISGNANTVTLPTTIDPFQHITRPVHISHNGQRSIGSMTSHTGDDLTCVTRESKLSDAGDDKEVAIACQQGEVLTGCTSAHQNNEIYRDGDKIEWYHGKISCIAVNGWRSTEGVKAIARCCQSKDMQCTYRASGPSEKTVGAQIETLCQGRELATGCTAYNWNSQMEGAFPSANHKGCIAQNEGTTVGVNSYAACCEVPRLACKSTLSKPSGLLKGNKSTATCEAGYVMTGCSLKADYGHSAGAYIEGNNCVAVNGQDKFTGEEGIIAVAVCCKLDANAGGLVG